MFLFVLSVFVSCVSMCVSLSNYVGVFVRVDGCLSTLPVCLHVCVCVFVAVAVSLCLPYICVHVCSVQFGFVSPSLAFLGGGGLCLLYVFIQVCLQYFNSVLSHRRRRF